MSLELQTLIKGAQKLSPLEQLELITRLTQALQQNYHRVQFDMDFWKTKELHQILQSQKVGHITDITKLAVDFWPEEESANDIIEYIYQQRQEDR